MMKLRKLAAGAALFVASAVPALAQPVNFTTTGRFTSPNATCNSAIAMMNATCTFGGFSLLYSGTSATNIGSGSVISLGSFRLSGGPGTWTLPPGQVTFELFISQTTPSVGSASFMGSVTGTVNVGVGGNVSSVMWTPTQEFRAIGATTYRVIFDNIGPAAGTGLAIPVNNERGINALVTTNVVPEPSAMVLMGTGFAVLFGMALRRKNA